MTILTFISIISIYTVFIEGDPAVFLALEHTYGIILLDLNNGNIETIVTDSYNPAIDYHSKQGLLYYTDRNARTISRIRYPFNGNPGISEIVVPARENHRPIDIAVDSINNYIYWADDFADSITRADLFGLDQTVILKDSNIQEIRGITLDNCAIYFTDKGAGKIEKINLDGSNRQTLYSNANSPNLIDLDITNQRLYWTNEGSQNIQSMTSGGKEIKTVVSYSHYPYGIQIYNNLIYWSQTRNGIVKKVDNSGGSYNSWYYTRPYNLLALKVYDTTAVNTSHHSCITQDTTAVNTSHHSGITQDTTAVNTSHHSCITQGSSEDGINKFIALFVALGVITIIVILITGILCYTYKPKGKGRRFVTALCPRTTRKVFTLSSIHELTKQTYR